MEEKSSALKIGRVVVVDDELRLMTVLCEMLAAHGYEAIGFASGKEALEALQAQEFDLLVTDLALPGMDGITLLKAALEIDPNLTGLIMTGHGTIQTAVEAIKIGAYDYILKPFKVSSLIPILTRAMETHRLRIENVNLKETVEIYELAKVISFPFSMNTILNKLADAAIKQINADEVSIMLPTKSDKNEELYIAVARGRHLEQFMGKKISINEGIAGWVARYFEPVILNGNVNDNRFTPVHPRSDIYSAVSVPMLSGGHLVGVLNLNITQSRRHLTLGQVKTLSILVSIVAPLLESSWLYEKVSQAQKKYQDIFDNAVEGIFQTTPDGRFLTANPALARMHGYSSPEEIISSITDIAHQLYVEPAQHQEFQDLLKETGEVKNFEAPMKRKDGTLIWVSMNTRAVRDAKGNILYVEGTAEDITDRKKSEETLARHIEGLRMATGGIIDVITAAVELRDPYTSGNQKRVSSLARAIAKEMGLPVEQVDGIRMAGTIHDLGKISIPSEILSKPTKLLEMEFSIIKAHPQTGYDILKDIDFPWPIAQIVYQHHERIDGSGYPQGLKGEETLIESRVLAVADVVEAMASYRPYRPALGIDKALEEIAQNKGILYDADAVEPCVRLFREKGFSFE